MQAPVEDRPALDEEEIRQRAYEQRADGGSPEDNWKRARQELLDERLVDPAASAPRDDPPAGGAEPGLLGSGGH